MINVSVILTTYNSEKYILEVLDSINNQEELNKSFCIELIIVDDCSSDKTTQLLNDCGINYTSTNSNTGGPNVGRNIALKRCTGDFIIIADHDDVWLPSRLRELVSLSHLAPIITSGYILYDSNSKRESLRINKPNNTSHYILYKENVTFLSKLTKQKSGQQTYLGSIMFSSEFSNIEFEEEYGMIDFDWVLRLFHNQVSVELCSPLYKRYVEKTNLSLDEDYRIRDYNYSLRTVQSYIDEHPKHVKLSQQRINGSLARYYYLIGKMSLARHYLLKSKFGLKIFLYLITTFVGSKLVKKYFNIFG